MWKTIIEITLSEVQTERQIKKKKCEIYGIKRAKLCITSSRRRERERKNRSKCIWRNYGWKFPKSKEGNRYPSTRGTKCPKQDDPKLTQNKICHN